jgi:hypothetical protein
MLSILGHSNHQNLLPMANQPIPSKQAYEMMAAYQEFLLKHDLEGQTTSVSFDSDSVLNYMTTLKPPVTDEFRICFGVYPEGHENAGRITVIVWPYKDGKPAMWPKELNDGPEDPPPPPPPGDIDPFNEGGLRP